MERAVTEAMQRWIYEKRQEKIAERELKLLEKGFNFGKKLYRETSCMNDEICLIDTNILVYAYDEKESPHVSHISASFHLQV